MRIEQGRAHHASEPRGRGRVLRVAAIAMKEPAVWREYGRGYLGMGRHAAFGWISLLATWVVSPASAADGACTSLVVEASDAVRALWPDSDARVQEAFAARAGIDRCARVRLSTRKTSIDVEVTLPDGRAAARSVARREDVIPTLAALLLVPESPEQSPEPTPIAAALEPQPSAAATPQPAPTPAAPRQPAELPPNEPGAVRIEVSLATGARIGDGQGVFGLGVLSFLDIFGWLVGFEGKVDGYHELAAGDAFAALELALLGGRRVTFGTLALDIIAGPALALLGASSVSEMQALDVPGERRVTELTSTEGLAPRLRVGAHLAFSADASLRWFVGVDGDLGSERALGERVPSVSPRLPGWTLGFALGATVGTL
jgi:hypothetical protein